MYSITPPQHFKTVPWKNGLGNTIELAINEGGSVADFNWRISIADMVQDGVFSDFSGYQRHLVMIAGNGLNLNHQLRSSSSNDCLRSIADVAHFDGASRTHGTLHDGGVNDFNVMVKNDVFEANVQTVVNQQSVVLPYGAHCFVYCVEDSALLQGLSDDNNALRLAAGHLLHIEDFNHGQITVVGEQVMVIGFRQV